MSITLLLTVGLLLALTGWSSGLQCYVCHHTRIADVVRTGSSPGCEEGLDTDDKSITKVACSGACYKSYSYVYMSQQSTRIETWTRGCADSCTDDHVGTDNNWMKCCTDKDLCNAASVSVSAASVLVMALTLAGVWMTL